MGALALAGAGPVSSAAQEQGVVRGIVTDGVAPVADAAVLLVRDGAPLASDATDTAGRYRLRAAAGDYTLRVQRLGFAELTRIVTLVAGDTLELDLEIQSAAVTLEGLDVEAERSRARIRFEERAGITVRELSRDEIRLVPGLAESDPLRAMEVLPGVVSTSDFSSAFHVRGGSQDQNLILLDGAPIFSPFHLGGFFSVFNADMVERAELSSGGFPAEFGGRVSSVLEVVSDPGDGVFGVEGGVSLLATRVAVGGGDPGGMRWRLSARRSYFDKLLAPFLDFPYHLQDVQGVLEAPLGDRDRIRVTAYTGDDVLDLAALDDEDFPLRIDWGWGNDVLGLTWQRAFDRGSWTTQASWSRFSSLLFFPDFDDTEFRTKVGQWRLRTAAEVELRDWVSVAGGFSLDRFDYDNLAATGGTEFGRGLGTGQQRAAFVQAEWGRPAEWLIETGLRLDGWEPSRGRTVVELSPRLAAKRFFGDGSWAVKAAAGRYAQFLHSLRDEDLPLGLDVWILASERAPHVVSDQVQVGIEALPSDDWTVALDAFWRDFDGVLTLNTADDPNTDLDDVLPGHGTSYGADLLVRKDGEGLTGWLALSFLKAERTFPDPLSVKTPRPEVTYPPIFDRRVDLDLVMRFPAPWGWHGGLRLNVGTGVPYTRPLAAYAAYQPRFLFLGGRLAWRTAGQEEGDYAVVLGDRNAERYPVYHRLDLSFRKDFEKSWGTLTPHVDVVNVLNRRNVLFYFYELERDPPVRSGVSMFPFLPTIGVEVRF